ncbi:hypothetical protein skT53_20830 [Effusibacillus dendaii]|uniref:Uncharacterized protein n=1 Tax=Effusibacillus dendaii TaxID=2743772 RepID=A0A7I8DA90_9BACL|nr:hypothetical protein skT53_20830 [Effusibacillus dendaii]
MYRIRQDSLFSLEELLEMSPKETYSLLFETLDIIPFLRVVSKKTIYGATDSVKLYATMLISLFVPGGTNSDY